MEKFKLRSYSKKELGLMYFPTATSPHSAVNRLMSWVYGCPELTRKLEELGYNKNCKCLSPRQVELMVYYLGEP